MYLCKFIINILNILYHNTYTIYFIQEELKQASNPETYLINFKDIEKIYKEKYPPAIIFSDIKTQKRLDKILVEKFSMIPSTKISLATGSIWKKKANRTNVLPEIIDVTYDAYIVPFLDNLKNLLTNEQILSNIENPKQYKNGLYRTVLDGSHYRKNEFFSNYNNSLAIIFYYDDLGITNPLGGASKIHKMSMFYWTLGNIHPELRSNQNAFQLYGITKTEYLKKHGALNKMLEPFMLDIKKLESEGININVRGEIKNFKGSLLFCACDTPAAALLGGFKESTAAYRLCRSCMVTTEEWKDKYREDDVILRNKADHMFHIETVTDPTMTKEARKFWQKMYGVNTRSPLLSSPFIDVTVCLPQDAMHVIIEGSLEIMIRHFLRYCIIEEKLFTIDDFNSSIARFNFQHLKKDKPGRIQREHLIENGCLHQKAGQMFVLAHTLLFMINEWIITSNAEGIVQHTYCFVLLLQILNITLAYQIHEDSIILLSRIIETFLINFKSLYQDSLVPKFHFLIHIPQYIKMFGPARQSWCFRFEACHSYFKSLVPVVRNFKNMALTLSYRHQSRLCSRLATYPGMPSKKFLYEGDYVTPGEITLVCNLPYAVIFRGIINEAEWFTYKLMRSSKIIVHGMTYCPKSILLLNSDENDLPQFGEIHEIFVQGDIKLFVITVLHTETFEWRYNAYYITETHEKCVKNINDLIFPFPLSAFRSLGNNYVPLINHERVEFFG